MCQESSHRAIQCTKPDISQAHRCSHSLLTSPFNCMTARGCRQLREERSIKQESLMPTTKRNGRSSKRAVAPLRQLRLEPDIQTHCSNHVQPAGNQHARLCLARYSRASSSLILVPSFWARAKGRKLKKKESNKKVFFHIFCFRLFFEPVCR